jgi:hypothetical protein
MKLFVITRKDLSNSQQAVQAGHAVAEFLLRGPKTNWSNGTLVYLGVENKKELDRLQFKLDIEDIPYIKFVEPDMNDEVTAIATDVFSKPLKKLRLL